MSQLGIEYNALRQGSVRWAALGELLGEAVEDLTSAPVLGLATECQGAASTFLTAWAGYAGESQEIVQGFAEALVAIVDGSAEADDAVARGFDSLDGRLGPRR